MVKLYIPILLIGMLFLFGQIGCIRGTYKILDKENETIVSSLYNNILKLSFDSEKSKNDFIIGLQQAAREVKSNSNTLKEYLTTTTTEYNTGYTVIDDSKNILTSFLISKYGDDIYKISVYGLLSAAGAKTHVNINESLSYEEFSIGMDFLLNVGHKDIEQSVKEKLMVWFDSLLFNQYKSLVLSQLVLLLFIISLPLIDFFIYKKWIEPKYSYPKNITPK
ncbi:hypothetical protein [Tenacibaculum sp. SDUM215027]|uniref:hypothetical protein n=1 Tax=Tenacibaculum sp. SDUM215027 TaxID=3422596 RepID=UPI003D310702